MKLDITDIETSAYQNFLDYIRNEQTRTKYSSDLKKFLDLVPDKIYKDNNIEFTDKTEAFVTLVRADVKVGKSIIKAYVRELKKKIDDDSISPSRVLNLIKPLKALFAANDIDFSWQKINKSIPKPGKSKDKAYTREQLQMLMANATNLVDKVMITLCSSAGFRVEAWDYFTWDGLHCKGSLAWLIWRTYYLSRLPMLEKRFQVATSWIADLLFKRDLTFVGKIKKKSLTKVDIKSDTPSIKDLFKDL